MLYPAGRRLRSLAAEDQSAEGVRNRRDRNQPALDSAGSVRAMGAARKIQLLAEQDPEQFVREVAQETQRLLGTE